MPEALHQKDLGLLGPQRSTLSCSATMAATQHHNHAICLPEPNIGQGSWAPQGPQPASACACSANLDLHFALPSCT